jgi:hypothetical protein
MSTTMRNVGLATQDEPISRGQLAAPPTWRGGLTGLERWAMAKHGIASLALTIAYFAALSALVAVLVTSALNSVLGYAVFVVFAAMVLVYIAVAIYTVIPERTPSRDDLR